MDFSVLWNLLESNFLYIFLTVVALVIAVPIVMKTVSMVRKKQTLFDAVHEAIDIAKERKSQTLPTSALHSYDNEKKFIDNTFVDYIFNNGEKSEIHRDSFPRVLKNAKNEAPLLSMLWIFVAFVVFGGFGIIMTVSAVIAEGDSSGRLIFGLVGFMFSAVIIFSFISRIKKFILSRKKYNLLKNHDYKAYLLPVTRKMCVELTGESNSGFYDNGYEFYLECDGLILRTYAYSYDRITDKALIVLYRFENDYAIDVISPE
ncbi:MAG: hypothetical protein FWD34_07650 [Oscillospiraceae bacterium]|nr:hypothetical protein [Oscillospiraceae bacterium]